MACNSSGVYEELMQKSVGELKYFLTVRGISVTGTKPELVARAFVAKEQNAPLKLTELELQQKLQAEYCKRVKELKIDDPLNIQQNEWKNDVTKWPEVDLGNIFSFILEKKEFEHAYIGKYKTFKAYSYFASGFVNSVLHYEDPGKEKVILRSMVTPSQKVRDDPRSVWVAVKKSGEIEGAWCSCTAGMSQACNHIMAVLYKMEYATNKSYNNPSCTDIPCKWNDSTFREVQPEKISNMVIRQSNRVKADNMKNINSQAKLQFDPRRENESKVTDEQVSTFLFEWKSVEPNAVIYKGLPKSNLNTSTLPPSVKKQAAQYAVDNSTSDEVNLVTGFLENLHVSVNDTTIESIEKATVKQDQCAEWYEQRKGRITSTIFHQVHTKIETMTRNPHKPAVVTKLISNILAPSNLDHIPAIKWGQEHQVDAKLAFEREITGKHHSFKVTDVGLVVDRTLPYIAASPDGLTTCRCCDKCCVEYKCPHLLRTKSVDDGWNATDFLEQIGTRVHLKKSHRYYTQIQGQMAITKCKKCYFVVWSPIGRPLIEEVAFDVTYWNKVKLNLCNFYKAHMAQVLLGIRDIYYCPICDKVILEEYEFDDSKENSVQCSACLLWYHWGCVGVSDITNEDDDNDWLCTTCASIQC